MNTRSIYDMVKLANDLMGSDEIAPFLGVPVKSGEVILNVPGYGKEDVKVTLVPGLLKVHLKDKLFDTIQVPRETRIEDVKVSVYNGQLKINFTRAVEEQEIKIT